LTLVNTQSREYNSSCGGPGYLDLHPDFARLPLPDQVRLVRAAWQEPAPRLLVFDNCEDERLLAAWRPSSGGSRVLLTSRRGRWSKSLGLQALPLDVLERDESLALLREFRPYLERALAIWTARLGPGHPHTRIARDNLNGLLDLMEAPV
jgi:hypothetical protein